MEKEQYALKQLRDLEVDIELVFLRDMLDREIIGNGTYENKYILAYKNASEDTKWAFARMFKEEINKEWNMWGGFIDCMALEDCYRDILDVKYEIGD